MSSIRKSGISRKDTESGTSRNTKSHGNHVQFLRKVEESESGTSKVLTTYHRVLGSEHPETLFAMYHHHGQLEKAVGLLLKVFETIKKVSGTEHSQTLTP